MIIKLCIDSAPSQPLEEGMQVVEAPDKISKKTAKLTGEALREMLFDVEWHCSDTGLAAETGFRSCCSSPTRKPGHFMGNPCARWGYPLFQNKFSD